MKSQEITIRSIQHYMYCPHRWGLIEINKSWGENIFVTKANLLHDRVHDPEKSYTGRGKKVYTSVPVYNDDEQYNLYGVTDCIELKKDKTGITIKDDNQRYKLTIVEYKPTKTSVYKGYKQDKIEMRGDRAEMSDFPLYLNTVAGGLDRRDQRGCKNSCVYGK